MGLAMELNIYAGNRFLCKEVQECGLANGVYNLFMFGDLWTMFLVFSIWKDLFHFSF